MNIHPNDMLTQPNRDDAAEALRKLREWAGTATDSEINELDPAIARLLQPTGYPDRKSVV